MYVHMRIIASEKLKKNCKKKMLYDEASKYKGSFIDQARGNKRPNSLSKNAQPKNLHLDSRVQKINSQN